MESTRYSSQNLVKLELPRQIFENPSNIKFHENTSCGNRDVLCGQTENERTGRHVEGG
jgi:hypothetical protein